MMIGRGKPIMARSSHSRFIFKKPSPASITVYLLALFAFSIFLILFSSRTLLETDSRIIFSHEPPSKISSQTSFAEHSKNQFNRDVFDPNRKLSLRDRKLEDKNMWNNNLSYGLQPCVKPTANYGDLQGGDRYLTAKGNGGLNQMRFGIADMVAISRIMNATLVIPQLDRRSFWKDSSIFSDIFDEEHFIEFLKTDVKIFKELPKELASIPRARKHFTLWSGLRYYEETSQIFNDHKILHAAKSDSRLANNDLPIDIQRLRCRALYNALRFAPPIESFGKSLVERLRSRNGRYIALHLRYEKDMLSFTGCTYGLTISESEELKLMRENTNHWKVKQINSTEQRLNGLCPLTPKEVGMFFQALGYPSSTVIYIAAGEIFGGKSLLVDLTARYPNIIFKENLATREELALFSRHASQTAALDYIISLESNIFVASYSGNMGRAVEGHRRFLGHRKTVNPNRKGLVELFNKVESGQLKEGPKLAKLVREMHKNRQGSARKRRGPSPGIKGRLRFKSEETFYENPYPECICNFKLGTSP